MPDNFEIRYSLKLSLKIYDRSKLLGLIFFIILKKPFLSKSQLLLQHEDHTFNISSAWVFF